MHHQSTPRGSLSTHLFIAWLSLGLFALPSLAQTAATGTIIGRVYDPASKEYVQKAEVRLQGTNRLVTTEGDGAFTLPDVPVGPATIQVSFTGYTTATVNLNISAGATATASVNLISALEKPEASDGTVKLEAFVVSTERQGNAKAIMDQKQSMNVSNIVASDALGNVPAGNVGEFLKYLPGIQMDYVEADARNPRLRGLPAQYTTVTFGGMDLASADGFIQNNGTDNSGGAGSAGRSFGFDSVSMASIDAIEVSFTTNASQSAGSAAGSIDLRPKHAYEHNGRQISGEFSAMMNSEELFWHQVGRPDDRSHRLVLPNGKFEYGDTFLDHRLGVLFSVSESNFFNEQRQYVPGYDTGTAANPLPPIITKIQYKDGPKLNETSTMSFTVDFKATDKLSLSLIGINNNYGMFTSNRSFGVSTTRAALVGHGDGWTSWDNVPVTISATAATGSYLRKRTHGYSYLPSFEYKTNNWFLTGALVASASENNYAGNESYRLPGASVGGVSLTATGLTASATRSADDLYSWKVIQTGGADWSNVANYKAGATAYPTFGFDGRYNRSLIYQGKLDARYTTPLAMPTWVKVGGKVSETTYTYQNPTTWNSWNYVGPGGGLGGNYALYPSNAIFSQGHGGYFLSTTGGTPASLDHNTIGALFMSHPEYFVHNDSVPNYLTSFVGNPKYIKEQVDALYAMFDSKPLTRLEVQAGVRWERTRDETKDFEPIASAKVKAAGYPINDVFPPVVVNGVTTHPPVTINGILPFQPTTIPGVQYQYFTNPRIARSSSYDSFFPSSGIKYLINPNLQALFGYSYTITRPAFGDLSGTYSEDDVNLVINAPNPDLKPQYANNYSMQLAYYYEPVGKFVVGVFENDIKNFQQTTKIPGAATSIPGFEDASIYGVYTLAQKVNIDGKVAYRGATVDWGQSLSFLPKPFNGLSVFANYARTYTVMTVPDPTQLHVTGSPYNFGWLPGIAPHVINGGITYKYRGFVVGVKARWQADMGTTNTYNTWLNQSIKYDVNAEYALNDHWKLTFSSRNITDVPDHTYIGTNRQQIGGGRAIEYYGAYLYAGVKARF